MDEDEPGKGRSRMTAAIGLGSEFAGAIALCTYLGYKADQHFKTGEAWTLTGIFIGLSFGFYSVWKLVRAGDRNSDKDE